MVFAEKPDRAIKIYPLDPCRFCYGVVRPITYKIFISSIESTNDSWIACGKGKPEAFDQHCPHVCPTCGSMYNTIMRTVPIHCEPFNCPKCGKDENLDYSIQKINAEDASFEFVAEIICTKCRKKKLLKKTVEQMFRALKIEIGPSGITVKKA